MTRHNLLPWRSSANSDSFCRLRTETSLLSAPSGPGSIPAAIIFIARVLIASSPARSA